jgi:hypothetical protein
MTSFLRFDKYPVQWWWRPSAWPVWNHAIDRAMRFWSHDGPDTAALDALAAQHHDGLQMIRPSHTEVLRAQLLVEHEAADNICRTSSTSTPTATGEGTQRPRSPP